MTYGITSESQIIDIGMVNKGCDQIDAAAKDFTTSGKKVVSAGNTCNQDALSVDDKSMQPAIEELGEEIKALDGKVTDFTAQIRTIASQIYNAQVQELRTYQEEQRKAAEEASNNGNS